MVLPLAEIDPNAFHVIGGIFAIWAVLVTFVGLRMTEFPKNDGGVRAVVAISALLLAGTVGAAIATSEKHEPEGGDRANPTHQGESPENTKNE